MSTAKAKAAFEQGLKTAETNGNAEMEYLFTGLLELTKSIAAVRSASDNIERKVK